MNAPTKHDVFTVGMRVKINYKEGKNFGKLGIITGVVGPCADVLLDDGKVVGYRLVNLLPVEPEPAEDPLTCELRVGDLVEVVLNGSCHEGQQFRVERAEKGKNFRLQDATWEFSQRNSLKLISRAAAPVQATPVQHSPAKPEPTLKKDEFSERGVLPSDVAGINEMVKRMFKEKRDETKPAPVKPPTYKGLLITASEKYLGLGFNDTQGRP